MPVGHSCSAAAVHFPAALDTPAAHIPIPCHCIPHSGVRNSPAARWNRTMPPSRTITSPTSFTAPYVSPVMPPSNPVTHRPIASPTTTAAPSSTNPANPSSSPPAAMAVNTICHLLRPSANAVPSPCSLASSRRTVHRRSRGTLRYARVRINDTTTSSALTARGGSAHLSCCDVEPHQDAAERQPNSRSVAPDSRTSASRKPLNPSPRLHCRTPRPRRRSPSLSDTLLRTQSGPLPAQLPCPRPVSC